MDKEQEKPPVEPKRRAFVNPYEHLDGCSENQILCFIDKTDKDLLRMIRTGAQGTFSTTTALLLKQLCHELRLKQITEPSQREQFESFVTNMRIVDADEYDRLCNSTAGRPIGLPAGPNDSGPTASQSPRMAERPTERSNVAGKAKRGKTKSAGGQ